MRLESALEVKAEALKLIGDSQNVVAFSLERRKRRRTTVTGEHVDFGISMSSTLNFGVGIGVATDHDCRLTIHYPWSDTSRAPFREELTQLARGELDSVWVGPVLAQKALPIWARGRNRPLTIGSSLAHNKGTAGTLTAFVTAESGDIQLLSCNHVLALCNRGALTDPIVQPSPDDGGGANDVVGIMAGFVPLDRRRGNAVDCAVATLAEGVEIEPSTLDGFGSLGQTLPADWFGPASGQPRVAKLGRTTGVTHGRRTVIAMTQRISYEGFGVCTLDDLFAVAPVEASTPFSEGGDSGALLFTPDTQEAAGILIGGSATVSYATRLDIVLSRLGVRLMV